MRKLKPSEHRKLAHDHIANRWRNWGLISDVLKGHGDFESPTRNGG